MASRFIYKDDELKEEKLHMLHQFTLCSYWRKEGPATNRSLFRLYLVYQVSPAGGGGAVHGGGGTQGVFNLLVQLVQLHQQQHHGVQAGTVPLETQHKNTNVKTIRETPPSFINAQ